MIAWRQPVIATWVFTHFEVYFIDSIWIPSGHSLDFCCSWLDVETNLVSNVCTQTKCVCMKICVQNYRDTGAILDAFWLCQIGTETDLQFDNLLGF